MSAPGPRPLPAPLAAQARARPAHPALVANGHTLAYAALARRAAAGAAALAHAGVRPGTRVALAAPATLDAASWLHALWWLGAVAVPLPARGHPDDGRARLRAARASFWLRHGDEGEAEPWLAAEPLACVDVAAAPWHGVADTVAAAASGAQVWSGPPAATSSALPGAEGAALTQVSPAGSMSALSALSALNPLNPLSSGGEVVAVASISPVDLVDGLPEDIDAASAAPWAGDETGASPAGGDLVAWPQAAVCPESFAPAAVPWALDAALAVVATSGSTGAPKAVALEVGQVVFSAFGSATRLGHLPDDVWLDVLPLHHVGGLSILWRALLMGTTVRLGPRFDAAEVARALADGEVTLMSLVPTMLAQALDAEPQLRAHPRLRAVLLGGAAAEDALLRRARACGLPLVRTWGMSEAASQVATQWPGEADPGDGDAGPPLPFAEVHVDGDGRLCVDGPVVAGPLRTDDVGTLRAGRVAILGRADDVFVSGGENVHPAPIEARLREHPAVADAAVVPVPDARWGQRGRAHLVATAGAARPDDAELVRFCRHRLASFQLPVQFVWQDRLPRDPLGKLRRRTLAEADVAPAPDVAASGPRSP